MHVIRCNWRLIFHHILQYIFTITLAVPCALYAATATWNRIAGVLEDFALLRSAALWWWRQFNSAFFSSTTLPPVVLGWQTSVSDGDLKALANKRETTCQEGSVFFCDFAGPTQGVQHTILTFWTPPGNTETWKLLVLSFLLVVHELLSCEELLLAQLSWALPLRGRTRRLFFSSSDKAGRRQRLLEVSWLVLTGSTWPPVILGVSVTWMEVIMLLLKAALPEVLRHPTARGCGSVHLCVSNKIGKSFHVCSQEC